MHHLRLVLVRTEIAGNLGSVARIARNLEITDLVLVAPLADPSSEQAEAMATHHARDLLRNARRVATLDDALADTVLAVATSSVTGGLYRRQTVGPPEVIAEHVADAMQSGVAALVFGPEPHGLSNDEVIRCHHLITIPANAEYSSFNLSQSAAICAYLVRQAWYRRQGAPAPRTVATHEDQQRVFEKLREGLDAIRFLRGSRGPALMHALQHLLGRAMPDPMEVKVLMGLARQLRYVAERATFEEDEEDEGP